MRPTSTLGRRSCGRPACATSTPSSATWRRCGSGATCPCPRPGTGCRSSTSATCPRSAGRATRSGHPPARRSSTTSWRSPHSSTRRCDDLAASRGEEAIGGYMVMNDWSARDLQREETAVRLGPAKGKDFATTLGPVAGHARRAGGRPIRHGLRPRRHCRGQRPGAVARPLERHPLQLRPDDRARVGRRSARAPATSSARAPSAAVACSRSRTNRASAGGCSPAIR